MMLQKILFNCSCIIAKISHCLAQFLSVFCDFLLIVRSRFLKIDPFLVKNQPLMI